MEYKIYHIQTIVNAFAIILHFLSHLSKYVSHISNLMFQENTLENLPSYLGIRETEI